MDDEPLNVSERLRAWAALQMIRETIETLGPVGALMSEEAVLLHHGPELVHEAQAICDALVPLLTGEPRSDTPPS
jgi:hypothetical protein